MEMFLKRAAGWDSMLKGLGRYVGAWFIKKFIAKIWEPTRKKVPGIQMGGIVPKNKGFLVDTF